MEGEHGEMLLRAWRESCRRVAGCRRLAAMHRVALVLVNLLLVAAAGTLGLWLGPISEDRVENRLLEALERGRDPIPLVAESPETARRLTERLWTEARAERQAGRPAERIFDAALRLSRAIAERWDDPSLYRTAERYRRFDSSEARESLETDRRLAKARRLYGEGDLAAATEAAAAALERYRAAGDDWGERSGLHLLGNIDWAARRIETAKARYLELRDRADAGGDRERFAAALGNLASLELEQGRFREAALGYRRLAAVGERHGLGRARAFARFYLGNIYHQLGLYERSTEFFARAEEEFRGSGELALEAAAAMNHGASLQRQGKRAEALSAYRRALALRSRSGDHRGRLRALLPVAELAAESGEVDRALALLGEISTLTREAKDGETTRFRWGALVTAGDIYLERGQVATAQQAYEEAGRLAETLARPLEKAETAWRWARLLDAQGESARAVEELSHAASIIDALRASPDSEEARVRFLAARRSVYEDLAELLLRTHQAPERAFETLERSRARAFLDLLQGEARVESSDPGELSIVLPTTAEPVALASVAAALPPDALLLHYTLASRWLAVLAIDAGGLRSWSVTRVNQGEIERLAAEFTREASGPERAPDAGKASRELARLLFSPVEGLLTGKRALVVAPDGILFSIPWPALPMTEKGRRVAELYELALEPSAAALVSLTRRSEGRGPIGSALVVGAPQAGPVPLIGARAEVERLGTLLPGARVLIGPQAEEARVRSEMGRHAIVHFATHARVDMARPLSSGLLLSGPPEAFAESRLAPLSPTDGVLTGFEVMTLTLNRGSLVTLAACQTASGGSEKGEGVAGLARAFFHAGARAVVASLWPVEDRATSELMVRFYARLTAGRDSTAAALARAQAELASGAAGPGWRHPYYWAGFVLLGDPR